MLTEDLTKTRHNLMNWLLIARKERSVFFILGPPCKIFYKEPENGPVKPVVNAHHLPDEPKVADINAVVTLVALGLKRKGGPQLMTTNSPPTCKCPQYNFQQDVIPTKILLNFIR